MCSSPGCNAIATKSMGELSERVKIATFLRYLLARENVEVYYR